MKKFKLFEDIQNSDYRPDESELTLASDPAPYKTNIAITAEDQMVSIPKKGKKAKIQKTDFPTKFDVPKRKNKKTKFIQDQNINPEDEEENTKNMPAGQGGEPVGNLVGQNAGMGAGGMDQSAAMGGMGAGSDLGMGMGTENPDYNMPKTDEQIGRIFELKKIYKRLLSLDTYLSFSSDPVLIKLRGFTTNAVELFEVVIANILKYQDRVDDIIVIYYKFLNLVYSIIKIYYKRKKEKEENENIE